MVIATTGDALHAPRVRPARLENALRRPMRDQCVIRAALGHRRNHGRHDVLDSQVLGRDNARRRAVLGTTRVWRRRAWRPTSFACALHHTGAHARRSYLRFAAAFFAATFFAATFFAGFLVADARVASSGGGLPARFRWKASIASTTGPGSKRTGSVVGSPVCLRVFSIAARAARSD